MSDAALVAGGEARPINLAIWGGCVSRDTVEFSDAGTFKLKRYMARHSLLADDQPASDELPDFDVKSRFKKRIIEFDIAGSVLADLRAKAPLDLILWDLNIERRGVTVLPGGGVVTNSPELQSVDEFKNILDMGTVVDFLSWEHRRRWKRSATKLLDGLEEAKLRQSLVVIAADWAEVDSRGRKVRNLNGLSPQRANKAFEFYYKFLEDRGVRVLRFRGLTSDPNHKWGPAPFHYTMKDYDKILQRIRALNLASSTAQHRDLA